MTTASDPAIDALQRDAATGAPDALFRLATALVAREEVEEAHGVFAIAAQRDHAGAQVGLARMLLYGVGAQLDVVAAVRWLQRAESAGHGGASYLLAMVALGDIAMERDFESAGHRLIAASKDGVVPALRALAMYFGRERDNVAAMRQSEALLAQAAGQGDGVSAALLAERVRHGELVGDVRYELAALLALAAKTGIAAMPSLPDAAVTRNGDGRLQLDLESSLRASPMTMHSQAPRVGSIDGLLSPEECRYVIAMGSPQLKRASVVDPRTGVRLEHPMRPSTRCWRISSCGCCSCAWLARSTWSSPIPSRWCCCITSRDRNTGRIGITCPRQPWLPISPARASAPPRCAAISAAWRPAAARPSRRPIWWSNHASGGR